MIMVSPFRIATREPIVATDGQLRQTLRPAYNALAGRYYSIAPGGPPVARGYRCIPDLGETMVPDDCHSEERRSATTSCRCCYGKISRAIDVDLSRARDSLSLNDAPQNDSRRGPWSPPNLGYTRGYADFRHRNGAGSLSMQAVKEEPPLDDTLQALSQAAAARRSDIVGVLEDLVAIATPNPPGENYERVVALLRTAWRTSASSWRPSTSRPSRSAGTASTASRIPAWPCWAVTARPQRAAGLCTCTGTSTWCRRNGPEQYRPVLADGLIHGRGTAE